MKQFLVILVLSVPTAVVHADVANLNISKTQNYDQTARTSVQLYDFSISAGIGGTGLNSTTPSGSNRLFPPGGGPASVLGFQSGYGSWYFDDYFPSKAALNAAHPNGTFTFLVGTSPAISIPLPSDAYPTIPVVTSSAGGWIGGRLCIGAPSTARGFHLSTNVSNGSGFLSLEIFDDNGTRVFNQIIHININHDQHLEVDVPPGLIVPGNLYSVEVEFDNVVSASPLPPATYPWAASVPDAYAFGIYSSRTFMEIYAVSAPQDQFDIFTARNELSAPQSTPGAVPFSDGVPNLVKYAFNMNGSRSDVSVLIPGTGESGLPKIDILTSSIFRFEFLRRIGSGLIYTPQKSSSLQSTSWQILTDAPTVIPINAEWERVIYEEPYNTAVTPQCFGRVQVILPTP